MTSRLRTPDDIVAEVIGMVGVHARALHALLSVVAIEWSDAIATACIECRDRPTLRLNPRFVAEQCQTPESLTALILHEMLHVTLGHTRLFPRPTPAHNVAFDAIINRLLLRSVIDAGADVAPFAALFTAYYAPDNAPGFLLRPPPGWPEAPDWSASAALPKALGTIHRRLYGTGPDGRADEVTYGDILHALLRSGTGDACDGVPLLGAHGTTEVEQQALAGTRDTEVIDALGGAMELLGGTLVGEGGALARLRIRQADRHAPFEAALRSWLRRGVHSGEAPTRRVRWETRPMQVVHRHEDRRAIMRAHVAAAFGAPAPLFFTGTVREPRPDPVHIMLYVDVSGSMDHALPRIRRTLRDLWRELTPHLYWFSTRVVDARAADLESGRIPSTGGTAIRCVIEHAIAAAKRSPTRGPVFVLTDGYLEAVPPSLARAVRQQKLRIHLGVIGHGPLFESAPWVTGATRLPSP